MKVDKNTIEKIAHLSRLYLNDADEERMTKSMNNILDWVEKLQEVDTEGVLPLTHMTEEVNIIREDEIGNELEHEKALLNAPKKDSNYFRVPKVIE